jgi:hypothetical protein
MVVTCGMFLGRRGILCGSALEDSLVEIEAGGRAGLELIVRPCCGELGALAEPWDQVEVFAIKSLTGLESCALLDEHSRRAIEVKVFGDLNALGGGTLDQRVGG